jgi:hypothetical protein
VSSTEEVPGFTAFNERKRSLHFRGSQVGTVGSNEHKANAESEEEGDDWNGH